MILKNPALFKQAACVGGRWAPADDPGHHAMEAGDPATGVVLGPAIDDKAVVKVEEHSADAVAKGGARALLDGRRHRLGGRFFETTSLADVAKTMAIARGDTFGPIAPLSRFKHEARVVAMASETEFGLASYFHAYDLSRVWLVAEALECGMVGISTGPISTAEAPFGGVKQSGLGREGSKYGIEEFTEIKPLYMGEI